MAPKKIDAMMHLLKEPKARELLCGFIGMVNYYSDIWIHRSHVLAPFLSLINIPWKWDEEQFKVFQEARNILSIKILSYY